MKFTPFYRRRDLVEWAEQLKRGVAARGDSQGELAIEQAIHAFYHDRFRIAVMGKAKRGKSTLINCLLGRSDDLLAPIDRLPASSAISRFSKAAEPRATVRLQSGDLVEIRFDQIREYVTEEGNPENVKEVFEVDICDNFPTLESDVELIDTPGAASIHEHHDALLHGFIPEADAIIFLVSARMPIDEDELALLAKIRQADTKKIFFAVNRVDECEPEDIDDAVNHNRKLLGKIGLNVQEILRISGKTAFQGRLRESGVEQLMSRVSNHLSENKGKVIVERFVSSVQMACHPCLTGYRTEIEFSQHSKADLEIEVSQLKEKYDEIRRNRENLDREFLRKWKGAIARFEIAIPLVQEEVAEAIRTKINAQKLTTIKGIQKELPNWIAEETETRLKPYALEFESLAQASCQEYLQQTDKLLTPHMVRFRKELKGGPSLTGTLGGTATTLAGVATIGLIAPAATAVAGAVGPAASIVAGAGALFGVPLAASAGSIVGTGATLLALTGPIGWTMVGVGLLTVSMSWRGSRLRQKGQLADAAEVEIAKMFLRFRAERIASFERVGEILVEEMKTKIESEIAQVSKALKAAQACDDGGVAIQRLEVEKAKFEQLLTNPPLRVEA